MQRIQKHGTKLVLGAWAALTLGGCLPFTQQGYPVGGIFTGTKAPSALDRAELSGDNKAATKVGRACSTGILGVAAWGDASVDAAKKAGGISSVHSVEYESTAVLGFVYMDVCTVVHGN
ncbi:MAG: hypothetical protein RL685_3119 [Pseudomonadota bacterium]|jgi:hypothetical protein